MEVPSAEWADWSDESRYLFVERRGMGASMEIALKQARKNHQAETGRLW